MPESAEPSALKPLEDVPATALADAMALFPEMDQQSLYESAGFTCVLIDNLGGDFDQVAQLELSEMNVTVAQAKGIIALSAEHVCPTWGDGFAAWRDSGGLDRLEQAAH